jgi:hypothetical protein
MCVTDIYHSNFFITDFEINFDGSEFILSSPTEVFMYKYKDKKYHQYRNIKGKNMNILQYKFFFYF